MVLKVFPCRNHPKYPPKYDLAKERPQSSQKIDFLMILDLVLGEQNTKNAQKSIAKIESKKKGKQMKKKDKTGVVPRKVGECSGLRVPPSRPLA